MILSLDKFYEEIVAFLVSTILPFQFESGEKDRIEAEKQAERDKVAQEMDEWQNLDDEERSKRYMETIDTGKDTG